MRLGFLATVALVAALAAGMARAQGLAARPAAADPALKKRCAGGEVDACLLAIQQLIARREAPALKAKLPMFAEDCEVEGASATRCTVAALAFSFADPSVEDRERSARYARKACDLGDSRGCYLLALAELRGDEGKPDPTSAAKRMKAACTAGNEMACWALGVLSHRGVGVPQDRAAAKELFRRGCSRADAVSCRELRRVSAGKPGKLAKPPRGPVGADLDWALAHPFTVSDVSAYSCAREDYSSCLFLVSRSREPDPQRTEELELAVQLFYASCVESVAPAIVYDPCLLLAERFEEGEPPVPRDPARARRLYRIACEKGIEEACAKLKRSDQ